MRKEIQYSLEILRKGGIILYPTDTVWGIGCDATNSDAIEKIYALKKRVDNKSMLVLVDNIERVEKYVQTIPEIAYDLIEVSYEPLTIIYPQAINLPENLIADDGSIGIRVTKHQFCNQLIQNLNRPIVSTSANISGEKPPLQFNQITQEILSGVDYVVNQKLDNQSTHKPSSIIKLGVNGEIKIIR